MTRLRNICVPQLSGTGMPMMAVVFESLTCHGMVLTAQGPLQWLPVPRVLHITV